MDTAFTPFASFGGGLPLGLGAVLLMLGLDTRHDPRPWLIFAVTGAIPTVTVPVSPTMIFIGGIIVGLDASLESRLPLGSRGLRAVMPIHPFIGGSANVYGDRWHHRFHDRSRAWRLR